MSGTQQLTAPNDQYTGHGVAPHDSERRTPRSTFQEAKSAFKTTEYYIYLAAVAGVLLASYLVGDNDNTGAAGGDNVDIFAADKAWFYIVILTVGYMFSRGLAKSGSRTDANS